MCAVPHLMMCSNNTANGMQHKQKVKYMWHQVSQQLNNTFVIFFDYLDLQNRVEGTKCRF